jgi:hypothetical protein
MAFAKIIEDRSLMAFVEKYFGTNAADVTGAANDENFHPRRENATRFTLGQSGVRGVICAQSSLFFIKGRDHLPDANMFGTRREHFQAFFL